MRTIGKYCDTCERHTTTDVHDSEGRGPYYRCRDCGTKEYPQVSDRFTCLGPTRIIRKTDEQLLHESDTWVPASGCDVGRVMYASEVGYFRRRARATTTAAYSPPFPAQPLAPGCYRAVPCQRYDDTD